MKSIIEIEELVKLGLLTEAEAIEYVADNYGDESENFDRIPVIEEYCSVDYSEGSQNVSYGDYVRSGYIVNWLHWHQNFYRHAAKSKDTGELEIKIYHTNIYHFIDGELVILRLYDTLTESQIR